MQSAKRKKPNDDSNKTPKANPKTLSQQLPLALQNGNNGAKCYNVKLVNLPLSVTFLQIISHFSLDAKTTVWLKCIVEDGEVSCILQIEDKDIYEKVLLKNNTTLKNRKIQVLPDESLVVSESEGEESEEDSESEVESVHSTVVSDKGSNKTTAEAPAEVYSKPIVASPVKDNSKQNVIIKQEIIEAQEEQVRQRISIIEAAKEHATNTIQEMSMNEEHISDIQATQSKSPKESRDVIYYVSVENLPSIIKVNQIVKHFSLDCNNRIKFIKSGISGGKLCKLRFQDKDLFKKALEKHHTYIGENRIDVFPDNRKERRDNTEEHAKSRDNSMQVDESSEDSSEEESADESQKIDNSISYTPPHRFNLKQNRHSDAFVETEPSSNVSYNQGFNVANNEDKRLSYTMGENVNTAGPMERRTPQPRQDNVTIPALMEIRVPPPVQDNMNTAGPIERRTPQPLQEPMNTTGPRESWPSHPNQDQMNAAGPKENWPSRPNQDQMNTTAPRENWPTHSNLDQIIANVSRENWTSHPSQNPMNTTGSRESWPSHPNQDQMNVTVPRESRPLHPNQDQVNTISPRQNWSAHPNQDPMNTTAPRENWPSHSNQDQLNTTGPRESRQPHINQDHMSFTGPRESKYPQPNQDHFNSSFSRDRHHAPIQPHISDSKDRRHSHYTQDHPASSSREPHHLPHPHIEDRLNTSDSRESTHYSSVQEQVPAFPKSYHIFLHNCGTNNPRKVLGYLGLKRQSAKIEFSNSLAGTPLAHIEVFDKKLYEKCFEKDNQVFCKKKMRVLKDKRFPNNVKIGSSTYSRDDHKETPGKRKREDFSDLKINKDKPNRIIKFSEDPDEQEPSTSKIDVVKERPNRIIKFTDAAERPNRTSSYNETSPSTSSKHNDTYNVHVKNLPYNTTEKMMKKILGFQNEKPSIVLQMGANQKLDSFVKFKHIDNFTKALSKNCTVVDKSLISVYPDENSIERKDNYRSKGLGVKRGSLKRRNVINRNEYSYNRAFHEYQQTEAQEENNMNISELMNR